MDNEDYLKKMIEKYKNHENITENQHYVPQFYLKKFTNSNWKLETLDIKDKRILKPQHVKHVCSWSFFYWVETWKEDVISQLLERLFQCFEDSFASIYNDLVNSILNNWKIDNELIFWLCEFVTISQFRWKYFREQLKDISQGTMKKTLQMRYSMMKCYNPNEEHIKDIVSNHQADDMIVNWKFDIIENNASYIKFITDEKNIKWFTNLFFNKKINIYIATWNLNFVTSDCCVIEILPEKNEFYWVGFFERLHYFVLSPKILIEFLPPKFSKKKVTRYHIEDWEVAYFNFLRWMSWRYLYSVTKDDLNEKLYSKARFDYTEKLYSIFPKTFKDDMDLKRQIKEMSKLWRIDINVLYDMIMNKNKTIEDIANIVKLRIIQQ